MSSTSWIRRPSDPVRDERRGVVLEGAYNTVLAVLLGSAVVMFIVGGTGADMQGLWAVALASVAISVIVFLVHGRLTDRRRTRTR